MSDREDDDELTKVGYSYCDTDESDDDPLDTARVGMDIGQWCKCDNCSLMASEIENYCCNDSGAVVEILDSDQANCIVECQKFKDFTENRNVLELLAYAGSNQKLARDKDNNVKDEGLRYACYRSYLHMIKIYGTGKAQRVVLPSCVVTKVRELYPDPSGLYTGFKQATLSDG